MSASYCKTSPPPAPRARSPARRRECALRDLDAAHLPAPPAWLTCPMGHGREPALGWPPGTLLHELSEII